MNRLEFKEVLKAVEVNNPLTDTHNRYGERISIISKEIIFIYNKLVMAKNLAFTITIDNMKKKGYSKKLVSDKK